MGENDVKDPREAGVGGMKGIPSLIQQANTMADVLMGTSPTKYKAENVGRLSEKPAIEEIGYMLPNFSKYDETIHTDEELLNFQEHRAEEQSPFLKATNAIVSGAISGLATALEDVGYILDFENHLKGFNRLDTDRDNWLSSAMRSFKEDLYEAIPIYETEGDTVLGQFFKFSTMRGMLDSIIGFALPGGVVAKGIGAASKLARLGQGVNKLLSAANASSGTKVLANILGEGIKDIAAGTITNYAEGQMMAIELGENAKQQYIEHKAQQVYEQFKDSPRPLSIENARALAEAEFNRDSEIQKEIGQQQADFVYRNRLFLLTDAIGLHGLAKTKGGIRQALLKDPKERVQFLKNMTRLNADNILVQGLKEGAEEIGQNIFQMEGEYQVREAVGTTTPEDEELGDTFWQRVLKFGTSKQALVEGLMGAVTGPGQRFMSRAVTDVIAGDPFGRQRRANEAKEYADQQAFIRTINNKLTGIVQAEALKAEAVANGDDVTADALWNKEAADLTVEAIRNGSIQALERSIDDMAENTQATPEERAQVEKLRQFVNDVENEYILVSQAPNSDEILTNRVQHKVLTNWTKDLQNDLRQKVQDINESLSTKSSTYSVHLDNNYNIEDSSINNLIREEAPQAYEALTTRIKQYQDVRKHLDKIDEEYKEITKKDYQKKWVETEVEKAARLAQERERQAVEGMANTPLIKYDENNQPIPSAKAKVVKDGENYYLRRFDDELGTYSIPYLKSPDGTERPVTSADLETFRVESQDPNSPPEAPAPNTIPKSQQEPEVKFFTPSELNTMRHETNAIKTEEDLNAWRAKVTTNVALSQDAQEEVDLLYKKAQDRILKETGQNVVPVAENPAAEPVEYERSDDYEPIESEDSLWDPAKRTPENYWLGSKGSEVISRREGKEDQIRWYDFLDQHDATKYAGVIVPFEYNGKLAGRLVLTNKKGEFIDKDGNAIGKEFDAAKCVYTTVADPDSDATNRYFGSTEAFDKYKDEYMSNVWSNLEAGKNIPVEIRDVSSGIIDGDYRKHVTRSNAELRPLKNSLPANKKIEDLTVYVSTSGRIVTEDGRSFAVRPGTMAIKDSSNGAFYRANSVPIRPEYKEVLKNLFRKYITQSLRKKKFVNTDKFTLKSGNEKIEANFFGLLRDLIRYEGSGDPTKIISNKRNKANNPTSVWNIGGREMDAVTLDENGNVTVNEEFFQVLDQFLSASFYNPRASKMNPKSTESFYFPESINDDGTINAKKYPNYHSFARENLVDFVTDINSPFAHAERYVIYTPQEVQTAPTVQEVTKKPTSTGSIIGDLKNGSRVPMTMTITNPQNGNINTKEFTLSIVDNTVTTSTPDDAFSALAASLILQTGENLGTLSKVVADKAASLMGLPNGDAFNLKISRTAVPPVTPPKAESNTDEDPFITKLKAQIAATTDPVRKAALEKALKAKEVLGDGRPGTRTISSVIKTRRIRENQREAATKTLNEAAEWFTKKFPGTDFEIVKRAIKSNVVGKFEGSVVTVYEGTGSQTVYHEAFHVILDCILSPEEKVRLVNEALANPEYKAHFDSMRPLYKGMSDRDLAEEVLAEAFSEYMVTEDENNSIIKRIFQWIKNALTNLYHKIRKNGQPNREWTESIESIANRVRNKDFTTDDYLTLRASKIHDRVIPGLDAVATEQAVNSVHYWFIQSFKDSGNLMEILNSENAEVVKKAYDRAYNEFYGQFLNIVDEISNGNEDLALLDRMTKIQQVLDTWNKADGVVNLHKQNRLAQYKLELNTAEDYQADAAEISGGENNQGRDSAALHAEAITVSSKMNSNKIVKLLLSTLPKRTFDPTTKEAIPYINSFGMPEIESFGKVFNILANKLANLPTGISMSELSQVLEEVAKEYPAIYMLTKDEQVSMIDEKGEVTTKTLPSWLKLDKVNEWTPADALQVIQFLQAFNNNKNSYLIGITKKNGQYVTFNASTVGHKARINANWRAQLSKELLESGPIAKFYKKSPKGRWIYNVEAIKKSFPRTPSIDNYLKFLHALGIDFDINNPTTLDRAIRTKDFQDKVNTIYHQITTGKLTTPVVFENRDSVNESLDEFLNVQAELGIETLENSHISLGDERIYDLMKPGFINQTINKLNRIIKNPALLYRELPHLNPAKNVYVTHSLLLNRALKSDGTIPKLTVMIHEGNREESTGVGVDYKDLKLVDKLSTVLNLTMQGRDNIMRPADNGQERFLDHGGLWVDGTTPKSDIMAIFKGYLWDEIARSHSKNRAFTNFDKNYNKGTIIESLLTKEEQAKLVDTLEDPETFANRILEEIGDDALNTRIIGMISSWAANTYNKLIELGGLLETKRGIVNSSLKLSSNPTQSEFSREEVTDWIRLAAINYAIGNIEQSKVLYGDNIFYKSLGDEFKRHNGAMGSKKTCLTGDGINENIKKNFKRMDEAEGLVDSDGNPIMRTAVFTDVPSYSEQLYEIAEIVDAENPKYQKLKADVQEAYKKSDGANSFEDMMVKALINNSGKLGLNSAPYADMTEGDGFGMISLDAYREFKVRVGDWTADSEKLYQWEVQERAGVPREERVCKDLNGKTVPLKYGDWGQQVFNSLKPQHFGPLANVPGFKPSFYKLSLMPMIPSVLHSLGNTNLAKLHELMIKNQIGVVVHSSANKGVTTKTNSITNEYGVEVTNREHPFNDFYDDNGNFLVGDDGTYNGPLDLLTQDTFWEYWGIQVDTGEHKHHDVVTGTQMMIQILNGIYDAGEVSEHFGENAPKVKSLVDEYISLNNQRIRMGRDQLVKELGLIATNKGWKISEEGIKDLVYSLRREAIERGLADNYITAIELLNDLQDGTTNIDILPTREKIESILMSRAASMTTSQKRHGTAAFQVPSTMWETKASRTYNDGKYKSSDLKFVVKNVDGKPKITSMEVYLPSPFKGITKVGQVPKELLQLIGFRIPTQGLSSIETIIVKGFLPEAAGDIIVLPTEIVAKAGSDFDIDKMYIYVPNYYKVKGKYKYIDYNNWESQYDELVQSLQNEKQEDILDELRRLFGNSSAMQDIFDIKDVKIPSFSKEEFHKKAIENRITNIQRELAHISENAPNFIAPIQTNILEASAKRAMKAVYGDSYELEAEYYKSKAALPSLLDPTYVLQVAENYMAGKKEVGIAANAGKFYVFASIYNLGIPAEDVQINFEHNESDGVVQLGRRFTAGKAKIPISELLNQWISAAVDAAKSPFGVNLGATPATLGTLTMLTMAGVNPDTIALFMNQPIIRAYLRMQQQYESQIAQENYVSPKSPRAKAGLALARLTKDAIRSKLSTMYPPLDTSKPPKMFTAEELEEYITKGNYTYQNQILDDFLRYVDWGRNVADAMQGTTYDTKDGGKNLSELLLKLYKSQFAGAKVINYDKLVDEGYISGYKNVVSEYKDFFNPLFLLLRDEHFTNGKNGMLDELIAGYVNGSNLSEGRIITSLNKFKNDFLTAIILNMPDDNGNTLISERKRLMVGNNSVPMKLAQLRRTPAFKDNPLFQALVPILDTIRDDIHNIKPFVDKDVLASNAVTYAWEELYRTDREFAVDIMKFALLQSGLQMSPLNFIDIIPATMYKDYISPMLNGYQELGYGKIREAFLYAWQLSNYNDDSILPFNLKMSDALPLGKRYFVNEDGVQSTKAYPTIRLYNPDKTTFEATRVNYELDSQSLGKNHQRQVYDFSDNSNMSRLVNELKTLRDKSLSQDGPYTAEEVQDARERQIQEDMENATEEDFYVVHTNGEENTLETPTVVEQSPSKSFIELGEERKKLCK